MRAGLLFLAGVLTGGSLLRGQTTEFTYSTLAGIAATSGSKDGTGGGRALPLFNRPIGVVVNSSGNVYVADAGNNLIRTLTPAGAVTSFVGTAGFAGGTDGNKTDVTVNLSFNSPQGPALDSSGNLYVADYRGSTIRKITAAGVVSTLAGTSSLTGSADGTGSAARFLEPSGLAVDSSGNVFVADSGNHTIRKITSAGVVTTFAGTAGIPGTADGTGSAARFNYPRGVAFDKSGNLLVADSTNNTIRKITPAGVVTTFAGSAGGVGSTDGAAGSARFSFPNSLAVDATGTVFVADENNHAIRLIAADGTVSTLAGQAGATGRVNGTGSAARFDHPAGLAVDGDGNLYVADYGNQLIRRVTRAGVVTTVAGVGGMTGAVDGSGWNLNPSLLKSPAGLAATTNGVYIADTGNNIIRLLKAGVLTTVAGDSTATGITDGTGAAARFFSPGGVAADSAGNLYVADTGNHLVRKISPAGEVTKLAGTALTAGHADGAAASATFNYPSGIAVDTAGAVYVADNNNHTIRKIGTDGMVTTFAGSAGVAGSANGTGGTARFSFPRSLAIDGSGNLYVADAGNHVVRKITAGGIVTTLAGTAGSTGSADGLAGAARFDGLAGISVDAAGNVYVADTNNSTIRKITPAGQVSTVGGLGGTEGTADGLGTVARFNHPNAVVVNAGGDLYIADTVNHTIRLGVLPGSTGGAGAPGSGSGGSGSSGGSSGTGTGAGDAPSSSGTIPGAGLLLRPTGLSADSSGNYYVTDTANHCIRMITAAGVTTVFAGKSGSTGSTDGTGAAALFNGPTGITSDGLGNFYVSDTGNATIRKITSAGVVTTLAGAAGSRGTTDGTGTAALFNSPVGIVYNGANGSLYVADSVSNTIRKVTAAGVVTTFLGTAKVVGDRDGVGGAALFNNPEGLAIDTNSILYVTDTFNHTIRKATTIRRVRASAVGTVTAAGVAKVVITDAGLTGSPLSFDVPVAVDDTPSAWVAKVVSVLGANTAVTARYTPAVSGEGVILTYVTSDDGQIANLALLAGSATGITDSPTSTATNVSGTVTTVAGSAGISGAYDGTGLFALFNLPRGLAVDTAGSIYVADSGNSSIRKITSRGVVTTLAGLSGISGFRDGVGSSALFNQPQGLFNYFTVMVVDTGNSVLRSVVPDGSAVNSLPLSLPTTTTPSTDNPSSGGGGGGAPSLWFIGLLGLLGVTRRFTSRFR